MEESSETAVHSQAVASPRQESRITVVLNARTVSCVIVQVGDSRYAAGHPHVTALHAVRARGASATAVVALWRVRRTTTPIM